MRRSKGRLVQHGEYLLVQTAAAALKRTSASKLDLWSTRLADFFARILGGRTSLALHNVRRVFPEKTESEARELVRRCWRHFARTTLEFLHTMDEPLDATSRRFDVVGWNHAEDALSLRRGVVVVTAHLGSWEFGLSLLSRVNTKFTIVARALDNELLQEKLLRARQRSEVEFVDRRNAARALVRTLNERGVVILVADQAVQPREGILAPFLGLPAWTTTAPARLSLKFNVPIVAVFCRPSGEGFTLEIESPIVPDRLAQSERTVEAITTKMNDQISRQIRRTPDLWLWMHNRWKGTS